MKHFILFLADHNFQKTQHVFQITTMNTLKSILMISAITEVDFVSGARNLLRSQNKMELSQDKHENIQIIDSTAKYFVGEDEVKVSNSDTDSISWDKNRVIFIPNSEDDYKLASKSADRNSMFHSEKREGNPEKIRRVLELLQQSDKVKPTGKDTLFELLQKFKQDIAKQVQKFEELKKSRTEFKSINPYDNTHQAVMEALDMALRFDYKLGIYNQCKKENEKKRQKAGKEVDDVYDINIKCWVNYNNQVLNSAKRQELAGINGKSCLFWNFWACTSKDSILELTKAKYEWRIKFGQYAIYFREKIREQVLQNLPEEIRTKFRKDHKRSIQASDIHVYHMNYRDTITENKVEETKSEESKSWFSFFSKAESKQNHGGSFQAIHVDGKNFGSLLQFLDAQTSLIKSTTNTPYPFEDLTNEGNLNVTGLNYWVLLEDDGNNYPLGFLDRSTLGESNGKVIDPYRIEGISDAPGPRRYIRSQLNPQNPESVTFLTNPNILPGEGYLFQTFGEDPTIHTAFQKEQSTKSNEARRQSLEFRVALMPEGSI